MQCSKRDVCRVVPPHLMMSRIMPVYAHAGGRGRNIPAEGALLVCAVNNQRSKDSAAARDVQLGEAREKCQVGARKRCVPAGHIFCHICQETGRDRAALGI